MGTWPAFVKAGGGVPVVVGERWEDTKCLCQWKHDLSGKEVTRVAGVKYTEFVSLTAVKAS